MSHLAIINCSLDPSSKSTQLGRYAETWCSSRNIQTTIVDLAKTNLPFSNGSGNSAYDHQELITLHDRLLPIQGLIFTVPIYNWDVNAAAKNDPQEN